MSANGAATTVAWFHCFAGIAGDMALGSLLDAGADARRGARASSTASPCRAGSSSSRRRSAVASRAPGPSSRATTPWPARIGAIVALDRGRRPAGEGHRAGARLPSRLWPRSRPPCTAGRWTKCTSTRSGGTTPSSTSSGPRRPSKSSGVDSVGRLRRGDRDRDGAQRPRPAAQPGARHRPPARGHPDLRPGRGARADHAHRRRHSCRRCAVPSGRCPT